MRVKPLRMKCTFRIVFAAVSLFATIVCDSNAQPVVQLLNLKAQYSPATPYVNDPTASLGTTQYEGTFLLPLEQKSNDVILVGGDYTQMNFASTPSDRSSQHHNLYSASMVFGYEKHFKGGKWKALALALPKVNSDFKEISGSDWQMGGVALATYVRNKNLKYHFGVYYNNECFGNYAMPLLGIDWKVNRKLNVFGDLPSNMNIEFKVNKSFYTGLAYSSIVSSYRLSSSEGNRYVRVGDKTFGQNDFKAYVNCYLTKHLVWYAEGGYTAGRMYLLYNANNERVQDATVYSRHRDGAFVNTGIAVCFRLDD